jgi:hypothetical protein
LVLGRESVVGAGDQKEGGRTRLAPKPPASTSTPFR